MYIHTLHVCTCVQYLNLLEKTSPAQQPRDINRLMTILDSTCMIQQSQISQWTLNITRKPVHFEVRSNMHMYYASGNHFYSCYVLCIPCLADIFLFSLQNTRSYEMFSDSHKYLHFTVILVYWFFHINDNLYIPCLADIFISPY